MGPYWGGYGHNRPQCRLCNEEADIPSSAIRFDSSEEEKATVRWLHPAGKGEVGKTTRITTASLVTTKAGKPALDASSDEGDDVIVVWRAVAGYRGCNNLTLPEGATILAEGLFADGTAGRMGNWRQVVFTAPVGARFSVKMTGRLYGHPAEYFYTVGPEGVRVETPLDRDLEI